MIIPTQENYDTLEKAKIYILKKAKENPNTPENVFASNTDVFNLVFKHIKEDYDYMKNLIQECIIKTDKAYKTHKLYANLFPPPSDININMMPIDLSRLKETLPEYVKGYSEIIRYCICQQIGGWLREDILNKGKIAYLTIHESLVEPGKTQRRPGLHIESPLICCNSDIIEKNHDNPLWQSLSWGKGNWRDDHPIDGMYIASSVDDMAKIYPYHIENPDKLTDKHGGIDHYRECIQDGEFVKNGCIYWLTDKTPHESLPNTNDKPIYRQFFRLVMGPIDVWYSHHNTPNPLGVQPSEGVTILHHDKFR